MRIILWTILLVLLFFYMAAAGGGKGAMVPQHDMTHEVDIAGLEAELKACQELIGYMKITIGTLCVVISALWLALRTIGKSKDAESLNFQNYLLRVSNLSKGESK